MIVHYNTAEKRELWIDAKGSLKILHFLIGIAYVRKKEPMFEQNLVVSVMQLPNLWELNLVD